MQKFISSFVPFASDGKIDIPDHIRHIKLDIGLSWDAPNSQYWLSHEENIVVFGFEPNPAAIERIKNRERADLGLDPGYLGKNMYIIACALGRSRNPSAQFYVTKNDCGCSSLYAPKTLEVEKIIDVPVIALSDFFDLFPFQRHPVIDYIKIDAQGSDLDIVKGAGQYLSDRVVFVTIEPENDSYQNTINSFPDIHKMMTEAGFVLVKTDDAADLTYLNRKYINYAKSHHVQIYQKEI